MDLTATKGCFCSLVCGNWELGLFLRDDVALRKW